MRFYFLVVLVLCVYTVWSRHVGTPTPNTELTAMTTKTQTQTQTHNRDAFDRLLPLAKAHAVTHACAPLSSSAPLSITLVGLPPSSPSPATSQAAAEEERGEEAVPPPSDVGGGGGAAKGLRLVRGRGSEQGGRLARMRARLQGRAPFLVGGKRRRKGEREGEGQEQGQERAGGTTGVVSLAEARRKVRSVSLFVHHDRLSVQPTDAVTSSFFFILNQSIDTRTHLYHPNRAGRWATSPSCSTRRRAPRPPG